MKERRKEERFSEALFLHFGPADPQHAGLGGDFSASGLYIQSQTLFPIQTELQIELHLPDGQKVLATGQVAWVKDLPASSDNSESQGMGIRLLKIPQEYHSFLEAFQ